MTGGRRCPIQGAPACCLALAVTASQEKVDLWERRGSDNRTYQIGPSFNNSQSHSHPGLAHPPHLPLSVLRRPDGAKEHGGGAVCPAARSRGPGEGDALWSHLTPSTVCQVQTPGGEGRGCEWVLLAQMPPLRGTKGGGAGSGRASRGCWTHRCCAWDRPPSRPGGESCGWRAQGQDLGRRVWDKYTARHSCL